MSTIQPSRRVQLPMMSDAAAPVDPAFSASAGTIACDRALRGPVVAVVTAAGSGTRLGLNRPKALATVGGRSLLHRAVSGILASGVVDLVVVTAPPESCEDFSADLASFLSPTPRGNGFTGSLPSAVSQVVPAGSQATRPARATGSAQEAACIVVPGSQASRQASVALGVRSALKYEPDAAVVLVHDAARAFTPPEVVVRVVEAVRAGCEAVIPVLPVTDTVKEVAPATHGREQVVATPDRSLLRAVQTPQGFRTDVLLQAHAQGAARSDDESIAASDDAGLVEALGLPVYTVAGDPLAFKVTHPLDLAVAQALADGEMVHPS